MESLIIWRELTGETKLWRAERLSKLGSSIFAKVAEWKKEAQQQGLDVIDLSIGSPGISAIEVN